MKKNAAVILFLLLFPFDFFCLEIDTSENFSSVHGLSSCIGINGKFVSVILGTSKMDGDYNCTSLIIGNEGEYATYCLEEEFDLSFGEICSAEPVEYCGFNFFALTTNRGYFYLLSCNPDDSLWLKKVYFGENFIPSDFKTVIDGCGRITCSFICGKKIYLFELNGKNDVSEIDFVTYEISEKKYNLFCRDGIPYLIFKNNESITINQKINWWQEICSIEIAESENFFMEDKEKFFSVGGKIYLIENSCCTKVMEFNECENIISFDHYMNCGEDFFICHVAEKSEKSIFFADRNEVIEKIHNVKSFVSTESADGILVGVNNDLMAAVYKISRATGLIQLEKKFCNCSVLNLVFFDNEIFEVLYENNEILGVYSHENQVVNLAIGKKSFDCAEFIHNENHLYLSISNETYIFDSEKKTIDKLDHFLNSSTVIKNGISFLTFVHDGKFFALRTGGKNEK